MGARVAAIETPGLAMHHGAQPALLWRGWTRAIDRAIGWFVEPATAALVVIEVCILTAGVYSRYVLDNALSWSDELASILFLWLIMLGAVSAYRRGEHMRLTALAGMVRPSFARVFEAVSTVLVAAFALELLAAVLWPSPFPDTSGIRDLLSSVVSGQFFSASYFGQEMIDFTPALEIPRTVAVFGIVVGLVLILTIAVLRLIDGRPRTVLPVIAGIVAASVAAYLGRDVFSALGNLNLILFFVVFVGVQIAIGVPIAFAFGLASLSYLALATTMPLSVVAGQMDDGMTNLVLLAIPLFVLLGFLIEAVGIAKRLVAAIAAFVGHLPGGLNIALVAAMFLVSGISGSKLADMAAVSPVLFPEMERRGYRRGEMIALLSTSGAMAELIPPSLVLIVVGTVCSLSIQSLFTGGLLPAAVAALFLIATAMLRTRGARASVAPRVPGAARVRALVVALPGLVLPLLIRYFVVAGIATATEVSTIGVIYSAVVGIAVYREFDWRRIYPILCETASLTGAIMLIIATATAMGWALTQSGFAAELAQALAVAPGGRAGFIIFSIIVFMALGSVLEGIPAIVLFGPLLFPLAKQIGIHEIHYAVIVVLSLSIGLFAPPFGVGYYGACAVGKCDPQTAAFAILPYLGALILALIVIAAVPWLSIGFL
jgi:tripartite ATP-independent transporter DctM subunit